MKKIFFNYSDEQEDVNLYRELKLHFSLYDKKGIIKIIDRDELFRLSGDNRDTKNVLIGSDIAVPLLSIDYLNNEECVMLLDTAARENIVIIPVLLRNCDWDVSEKLRSLKNNILPDVENTVNDLIRLEGNMDKVLSGIAKKVKAIALKSELDGLPDPSEAPKSKTFYYVLSGLLLLIGGVAAFFTQTRLHDWLMTTLVFLLFLVIILLAGRNIFFPTKIHKK